MDQFGFNFILPEPDFSGLPHLMPSDISISIPTQDSDISTSHMDNAAKRRREQNRRAQRRHREKKKRQLEEEKNLIKSIDINGSKSDSMSLQRYYRSMTNSDTFQAFPDENCIAMPLQDTRRAYIEISLSIAKVIPSFKVLPLGDDYLSPFYSRLLSKNGTTPSSEAELTNAIRLLPENLRPTRLQLTLPHHCNIDILPWPSIRDKLLLMKNMYAVDQSYKEFFAQFLVWGNRPEFDDNWELTPSFAYKLWFLLDEDIIKRGNWWRSQRNLPPIDVDLFSKGQAQYVQNNKIAEKPI